jgi:glutaredoxin
MNIGECPYNDCDEVFLLPIPKNTPTYQKRTCPTCKRPLWYKFSRINPEAWTEEDFLKLFTVDEETKEIRLKQE